MEPPEQIVAARPARRVRRIEWVLAVVLLLALLWGVVVHRVVPGIAADAIVQTLSAFTGRPASVGRVEIDPWLLRVRIHQLSIGEATDAGGRPARTHARIGLIEVDLGWSSLPRRAAVVQQLRVVDPQLALIRDVDGRWDAAGLLERGSEPSAHSSPGHASHAARPAMPRFILGQASLEGGRVTLVDRQIDHAHELGSIELSLDFLSSLPADRSAESAARLSLVVDGASLRALARATPFAGDPAARIELTLDDYPLTRLAPWIPAPAPVRIESGQLSTTMTVTASRAEGASPDLLVRADAQLGSIVVRQPNGRPLLDAPAVRLQAIEIEPFARRFAIDGVELDKPRLWLARQPGEARFLEPVLAAIERTASPGAAAVSTDTQVAPDGSIRRVLVDGARLEIDDAAFQPGALKVAVDPLRIELTGLSLRPGQPVEMMLTGLADGGERIDTRARILHSPLRVDARIGLDNVGIARWAWLAGPSLGLQVDEGRLAVSTMVNLRESPSGSIDWRLDDAALRIEALALRDSAHEVIRIDSLEVGPVALAPADRSFSVGAIGVSGAQLRMARLQDGGLDVARWWQAKQPAGAQEPAAGRWQGALGRFALDRARVSIEHAPLEGRPAGPALVVEPLSVELAALSTGGGEPARLEVRAGLAAGASLSLRGTLDPARRALALKVNAAQLALPLVQPWLPVGFGLELDSGRVSAEGDLSLAAPGADTGAAPSGRWQGAVRLDDLSVLLRDDAAGPLSGMASSSEADRRRLVGWRSMRVSDLDVDLEPLRVDAGRIELDRLRARLAIGADGQLNLSAATTRGAAPAAAAGTRRKASAPAAGRPGDIDALTPRADDGPPMGEVPTRLAGRALQPSRIGALPVRIGEIVLTGGQIDFSDEGVRPRFAAELTSLAGRVGELRPGQPGTVSLAGRVDNTGALRIEGRFDPFAEALFVDLRAEARDIDLPVLTPYSSKYIGYGIEKGKLSARVDYKVEQRRLEARHEIVLDQLTLGEAVESPDALKLPVTLALALLKDRNGVIDVRLPIGGSLDDPQFAIGGIVLRIITNLIVKAVTSPFSLIAGLAGAADAELSTLAFAPGQATLEPSSRERLARLATGLAERPGLRLDITGRVLPGDAEALHKATEAQLRELANRRALVAKDWLSAEGRIDASRLFITAPSVTAAGGGDAAAGVALRLK